MAKISRILLPVDFTECSVATLDHARLLAETFKADLYLFYAMPGPEQYKGLALETDWFSTYHRQLKHEAELALDNFVARHMQGFEPVDKATRVGDVVEEVISYAKKKKIDLIITASHGCQRAERQVYGSIAESLCSKACCPVMIIHS
ncbi:MAG: universal stress protein [Desulfobulbaceae bacterium]|uniref:Universal stress protein n=1 Tax=Candidatus Desulfatifera sulfidica TaxID=2841691 RepID=A0A8J6N6K8_9BACT|nr:universal stress protein [Candidatus Desulfatifera sulfidica]